ncbi:MAG TPA: glycosyltransferase family 4 protein, partial [Chloroflexota bacterium]|nr:glycosyltransferase family 4 protein [Chloroflexota bacterium]
MQSPALRIAYVGSFPPRECGIATFTRSVLQSVDALGTAAPGCVVAMNPPGQGLSYPPQVITQIEPDDVASYDRAARLLNRRGLDVVNVQHEYGLFGGRWGQYLLDFLDGLHAPAVLTLHTILPEPGPELRGVTQALVQRAAITVVLAETAIDILAADYSVDRRKLRFIPHGAPNVPPDSHAASKRRLGLGGRTVLATCGLISPGKGIEYAVEALPDLVQRFPNLLYVIAGETHPGVRALEGERYREQLHHRVDSLGVADHVSFVNRYLSYSELLDYLLAADVYVVPYLNLDQIVSGTLAYALGCGAAIVSTPSVYAREVLGGGRGLLVPVRDSQALGLAVARVLSDASFRDELRTRAYAYGHQMIWPNVARSYLDVFADLAQPRP